MALRCTGSNRRKYHAERTESDGTKTGACMDCDGRFGLHYHRHLAGILLLDAHEPRCGSSRPESPLDAAPH